MTYDQASVCIQCEDREWKYQRMGVVDGLARRFSVVHSNSQEQSKSKSKHVNVILTYDLYSRHL